MEGSCLALFKTSARCASLSRPSYEEIIKPGDRGRRTKIKGKRQNASKLLCRSFGMLSYLSFVFCSCSVYTSRTVPSYLLLMCKFSFHLWPVLMHVAVQHRPYVSHRNVPNCSFSTTNCQNPAARTPLNLNLGLADT